MAERQRHKDSARDERERSDKLSFTTEDYHGGSIILGAKLRLRLARAETK